MTITVPKGFQAAGVSAGIRSGEGPDLALVVNDGPSTAVAVQLTTNRFAAAPVQLTRENCSTGMAKAVVLNAGCANACTGQQGKDDAYTMAKTTAEALGLNPSDIAVCSTGMIGEFLPMDNVKAGIHHAAKQLSRGDTADNDASNAILTTDTHPKTYLWTASDDSWSIGSMIKGAGMLAPGMATMLCVLTTDADVSASTLDSALAKAVDKTLNRVDSDGCMSTNDTVVAMASGASDATPDEDELTAAFTQVLGELGMKLVEDAEGVNHTVAITVSHARTEEGALAAARAVSRSNLVKTAIFGNDPNWGRIVSELGTISADVLPFDPEHVSVAVNDVRVFAHNQMDRPRSEVDMTPRHIWIDIAVGSGKERATVLTNDLSHDYVHINSAYSS